MLGIAFWNKPLSLLLPFHMILLFLIYGMWNVLSATFSVVYPRHLAECWLSMYTNWRLHTTRYLLRESRGYHLCILPSAEASATPLKCACSPYSIPTKMPSRNDLKCSPKTWEAVSRQSLEQLSCCVCVCPLLIWPGVLLSVLSMGWGAWTNSGGRITVYQE